MSGRRSQVDLPALVHRLLRLEAHVHRPSPVDTGRWKRLAVDDRADEVFDLVDQLVHLAGDLRDRHVDRRFAGHAALVLQRERRVERPIHRTAPTGPQRAFAARDFDDLMMLPRGQRLRNRRVSAAGEAQHGGEVVLQLRVVGPTRGGVGEHGGRLADALEVPAGEVEEMDGLFEDPVPDAVDVIAPPVGPETVGAPPQLDQRVLRVADVAGVDHLLHLAPQRRKPQLVADREELALAGRQRVQRVAVLERQRHRLFEQQVTPGLQHGGGDFEVQVGGKDDGDDVEVLAGEHVAIIGVDACAWPLVASPCLRRFGTRGDRAKLRARALRDGPGVVTAPGTVPDQPESDWLHPDPPDASRAARPADAFDIVAGSSPEVFGVATAALERGVTGERYRWLFARRIDAAGLPTLETAGAWTSEGRESGGLDVLS